MTHEDIPAYHPPLKQDTDPNKVHLFTLADKRYYMDKVVPPNIAFRYLRDIRKQGQEKALANVIYDVMGDEAMDALAEAEDMTPEDATQIMDIIKKHVVGQLEKYTGK